MGLGKQLRLLLRKNYILQTRRWCVSIFEILIPVGFMCLFLLCELVSLTGESTGTKKSYSAKFPGIPVEDREITGYTPKNTETSKVMSFLKMYFKAFGIPSLQVKGFSNEAAALEFHESSKGNMTHLIVFNGVSRESTSLPPKVHFTLRTYRPGVKTWNTKYTFPTFQTSMPRGEDAVYFKSGVLQMQYFMGLALAAYRGSDKILIFPQMKRLATLPWEYDSIQWFISKIYLVQSTLILGFFLIVFVITKILIEEKKEKIKESMKLMGMHRSAHWLSWFVMSMIYLIPATTVISVIMWWVAMYNSDFTLLYSFLLIYAVSICSFCFLMSTIFNGPSLGAATSGIVFLLSYVFTFFVDFNYEDLSYPVKVLSMLLFNNAMCLGTKLFVKNDISGTGQHWTNLHQPAGLGDDLCLLDCMAMLWFDTGLSFILAWHLDNVMPGEFGVPKPWNFIFKKSYWLGKEVQTDDVGPSKKSEGKYFEREPNDMKAGIQTKNLRKVFGKNVAVAGTSVNMYEGQITVLLGHNGAGKTTTMSMLTGFIPPSSGTAIISGCDIRTDIEGVRRSLGLCPQHDVLFGSLTVRENLEFFAELKGMPPGGYLTQAVWAMVQDVELAAKVNTQAKNLSGGQKRKLCVGIALIGGSKVVILDEPTSGLDPGARRKMWAVLQRAKEGRTILLTTHYMDEADMLGDRIAIMHGGVIECCGTSMFLKKLYGTGYHLIIVKEDHCDEDSLTKAVKSYIESAKLETIINREVSYHLPVNASSEFASLFKYLDENKEQLGIISFGTTATTMEEVFLRVGHELPEDKEDRNNSDNTSMPSSVKGSTHTMDGEKSNTRVTIKPSDITFGDKNINYSRNDSSSGGEGFSKSTGFELKVSQMYGLFVKKALATWRNKLICMVQIFPIIIFTWLAMDMVSSGGFFKDDPPVVFDMARFEDAVVPYTAEKEKTFSSYYAGQFEEPHTVLKVNVSGKNTFDDQVLKKAQELGKYTYRKTFIIGMEVTNIKKTNTSIVIQADAYYGGEAYHSEAIAMNYLMNGFLLYVTNGSYSLQFSFHPLPQLKKHKEAFDQILAIIKGFFIPTFITFGMAFLTSFFVLFLVKDRKTGAKHLETVSGVGPISYWLPVFAWDFLFYLGVAMWIPIFFAIYDQSAFVKDGRIGVVILMLCLNAWSMLPCMYLVQYVIWSPGWLCAINIMTGVITCFAALIVQFISSRAKGNTVDWIFSWVFPHYNIGRAIMNMYLNDLTLEMFCGGAKCTPGSTDQCCPDCDKKICFWNTDNPLVIRYPGIGRHLLAMAVQGVLYFALIFAVDYNLFLKVLSGTKSVEGGVPLNPVESDVDREAQRVHTNMASNGASSKDTIQLVNLSKRYRNKLAVNHVSLGIAERECFGLLGQNGAGKTSIFKMLTGEVLPSSGNAYLGGFDIRNDIQKARQNLGYCPQFDALNEELTGRETLTLYARLRGFRGKNSNIKTVVNGLLEVVMLSEHADKLTGKYSGGSKRKLSTAVALVGDPAIIMLDEPTCGVDPEARRHLWNVLSQVRSSGRTMLLTSHSMEECDALCTRLLIMANAQFLCIGTPQQLKSKYGQGYTIIMKINVYEDGTYAPNEPVIDCIQEKYPEAYVFNSDMGYLHLQVPNSDATLADVFELMEFAKQNHDVEDYSVQQTTLEQVFLSLTWNQIPPAEEGGCCAGCCSF